MTNLTEKLIRQQCMPAPESYTISVHY